LIELAVVQQKEFMLHNYPLVKQLVWHITKVLIWLLMPRTLKLWEGKYSMRTMMLITIMVLLTMTMAKSEETVETKVKNYIVKEWNDIKEYQKVNWEKGKEQNKNNWNKLNLYLEYNNVTQDC
jgi:hypothetical protein